MKVLRVIGLSIAIIFFAFILIVILALLFLKFYPTIGKLPDEAERESFHNKTTMFYEGMFHNEEESALMSGEGYQPSPRRKPKRMIKAEAPELIPDAEDKDLSFTWLGHSSFLLQMGNKNILVDPVLSQRSSPVSFAGPERFSQIPLTVEQMPRIDVLLLSHDHYDHMDYNVIRKLKDKVGKFVVPLGVDAILRGWSVDADKICSLNRWDSIEIEGTVYTLTPSQHFTGRNPLKRNSTYWGGYYIDNGFRRVYYTGDGGYCDAFKTVKERLGSPDLMIAECGQYDPAWSTVHMFPEETVRAAVDTGAAWMIPVHWGTFCICNHAWDDPIMRVSASAEENNVNMATPRIGQTVIYDNISDFNEAWWKEYD